MEIRPQAGPQEAFLASPADIAIYGGAAGGGKSYALLMEPLRHITNSKFGAVIFRRTMPQITIEGGLWDTASELYVPAGGRSIQQPLRYIFPSKVNAKNAAKIEFHHLQHEKTVYDWQGSQIALIEWDELTHFTQKQFFYMLSRNRSMCGVWPYIRATTNPEPDTWVKQFVRWWLDADGEYADPAKAGVIRWMIRSGDDLLWFDTRNEAVEYMSDLGIKATPKSVTFVPSSVYDNRILLEQDPGYLANLQALPRVERARLVDGNWKVRATAGTIFSRDDFEIVEATPTGGQKVRAWDRAATEPNAENPNPDWTAGVRMERHGDYFYITDVKRFRAKSGKVKTVIQNTTSRDGTEVTVVLFQDPGAAGKSEVNSTVRDLAGYPVKTLRESGKKYLRWQPLAAQAQAGYVKLVRGAWNEPFLSELENLSEDESEYAHDDQADAAAGAFEQLTNRRSWRPL